MPEQKVRPDHGDLIMPEDMQQVFQKGGPPNFRSKTMVLMGPMGVGKTTLFNKLTGLNCTTSAGAETCTKRNKGHFGFAPADALQIVDTPGYAASDVQYEHALEVRKALTTGTVSQIVAVQSLPNNSRTSQIATLLQPIDKIMTCDTFWTDSTGIDTRATGRDRSPCRTRAFLVLTFRDQFPLDRKEWIKSFQEIREKFRWVGPVALIDMDVSVEWLYNTIVACAGYTPWCCTNHFIPLVEFFVKFPLTFNLTEEQRTSLASHKFKLRNGILVAQEEVAKIKKERMQGFSESSGYVEKFGASLDCLIRFLDDLYDCTTLAALAEMYECEVDDLWASTDEAVNHGRVERWNAIKMDFATDYQDMKKMIQMAFPDEAGAAVYKRCPHCREVYVKPMGCDFGTTCGNSVGGADTVPYVYSYNAQTSEFKILSQQDNNVQTKEGSNLQYLASKCRKAYRKVASYFWDRDDLDESTFKTNGSPAAVLKKRGCGLPLKWETAPCLTRDELNNLGLVPDYIPLEPCKVAPDAFGVDAVVSWLEKLELGQYKSAFKENSVVDKDIFCSFTEEDLRADFGVQNKYHVNFFLSQRNYL